MNDEDWKEQYKQWKEGLKPFQIKLLDEDHRVSRSNG